MKVLVTDGDYKHTLGIVRSLGRRGHEVSVLSRGQGELASRSRFCFAVEFVPDLRIENYQEVVLRVLKRKRYDLLMPVGFASTLAMAKGKEEINSLTRTELADASKIEFAGDKRQIAELAAKLGLHTADAIYPSSVKEAQELTDKLGYPVILKPPKESLPKGVRFVGSREEFMPSWENLRAAWPTGENELPVIQSYVAGYGCGFFALYQNGVCKRVFMHRRIREYPPGGGGSCCAESFYDPVLKDAGIKLLDAMSWHGVAMVEFRYDPGKKKYVILEVNPKFWGSLDLALAAGADFPGYLCEMAAGKTLHFDEAYCRPLRFHWPFSGEIQHLWMRPEAFRAIAVDLLNPLVKSNLWLSDPAPNAQEFLLLLESFRRRVLKG